MKTQTATAAAVLLLSSTALAQAGQPTAAEPPSAESPTVDPEGPKRSAEPDLGAILEAVRQAAEAAREAAEASREAATAAAEAVKAVSPAPAAAAVVPESEAEPAPDPDIWSLMVGMSLVAVTGNANAFAGKLFSTAGAKADPLLLALRASGSYGQTQVDGGADQTTAATALASLRLDWSFIEYLAAYVSAGTLTDRVASIEYQILGGVGLSVKWLDRMEEDWTKLSLKTDFGFQYTREARRQYFPTEVDLDDLDIFALRAALHFRYGLTANTYFIEDLELLPDIINPQNFRLTSTSTLAAQVASGLALTASVTVRYIGAPPAGAQNTDTEITAGLTWNF